MPNNVTHFIEFSGPKEELSRLKEAILTTEDETTYFDFDKILPMPEELNTVVGDSLYVGMNLHGYIRVGTSWKYTYVGKEESLLYWSLSPETLNVQEFGDYLLTKWPDAHEKGEIGVSNFKKYGHVSWYSWRTENWGTKWNSYDYRLVEDSANRFSFQFDTAWSTPFPVLEQLIKRFPDIDVSCTGFDEGHCFYTKLYGYKGVCILLERITPRNNSWTDTWREAYKKAYRREYMEDQEK